MDSIKVKTPESSMADGIPPLLISKHQKVDGPSKISVIWSENCREFLSLAEDFSFNKNPSFSAVCSLDHLLILFDSVSRKLACYDSSNESLSSLSYLEDFPNSGVVDERITFGLGYCSALKDYRLVVFCCTCRQGVRETAMYVYSFQNLSWRKVRCWFNVTEDSGVFADGNLYFVLDKHPVAHCKRCLAVYCVDDNSLNVLVGTLDVSSSFLGAMSGSVYVVDLGVNGCNTVWLSIIKSDNTISVVSRISCFSVLHMRGMLCHLKPLILAEDGSILFLMNRRQFLLYNCQTKRCKRINVISSEGYDINCVPYKGRLITSCKILSSSGLESDRVLDPSKQFVRSGLLRNSSDLSPFKTVYVALNCFTDGEFLWTELDLLYFLDEPRIINMLELEVPLLMKLEHKCLIRCYNVFIDCFSNSLSIITDASFPEDLRSYLRRNLILPIDAVKVVSRQILEGLLYLHSRDPIFIHRGLHCGNVYIDDDSFKVVRVGIPCFNALFDSFHRDEIFCAPEFIAPELYSDEYTELVDIYSFGMCLLEMVTLQIPYSEFDGEANLAVKVLAGVKPCSLSLVSDPQVKAIIEKCIGSHMDRPSAYELLNDRFFSDV